MQIIDVFTAGVQFGQIAANWTYLHQTPWWLYVLRKLT